MDTVDGCILSGDLDDLLYLILLRYSMHNFDTSNTASECGRSESSDEFAGIS
jgi:hypothetical protein